VTYAPGTIVDLSRYWTEQGGVSLGIVGDAKHRKGYHLGRDRIYGPNGLGAQDYSVKTPRDRLGLSDAASAIDLGKLGGTYLGLWDFSAWLAGRCMTFAPGTIDVREIIFWDRPSQTVLGWSSLTPDRLIPGYGDSSHRTHTHISFYRDSESRSKTALFAPYFADTGEDVFVTTTEWCCEKHGEMASGTRSFAATPPFKELDNVAGPGRFDAQVVIDQTATPHGTFLRLVTGTTGRRLVPASSVTLDA
jgi:hypothetical protein